jgi:predicted MFS family arabinose efflux permease
MASMTLGGVLAVWGGYNYAFLALAGIAVLGAILCWLVMPETRDSPRLTDAAVVATPAE